MNMPMPTSLRLILVDSQGIFEWEMRHLWHSRDVALRSGQCPDLSANLFCPAKRKKHGVQVVYSDSHVAADALPGTDIVVLCSRDELAVSNTKKSLEGQKIKTFSAPTNEDPESHLAREVLAFLSFLKTEGSEIPEPFPIPI